MRITRILATSFLIFLSGHFALSQTKPFPPVRQVELSAGSEYETSPFYELLFGKNWRAEWATIISVKPVSLDTLYGGLKPYARSGGGESKSLRLRSSGGKEYALRSINKTRSKLLPKLLRMAPYGALVQDGISMSHPFAAFALPDMLTAAGILHANPKLVYLPVQPALDSFNTDYGGDLYLIEERAEGSWAGTKQLGGFDQYMDTEAVKDSLRTNHRIKVDQHAFLKARLFDILISDVDRHGGNWNWGVTDTGCIVFTPIPGDRDQAFFTHNGLLTKLTLALTRRRWMQSFRPRISNVATLTSYDQKLDRFFANEATAAEWQAAATQLQQTLTDDVIEGSVGQLPPEVFERSGQQIIKTLKARRGDLHQYAQQYYRFLARSVDINGTSGKDWFIVRTTPGGALVVAVYGADAQGQRDKMPYYQRSFQARETVTIRLFGSGGDDLFDVEEATSIRVLVDRGINEHQFIRP